MQNRNTQVLHGRLPVCTPMLHGNQMLHSKPFLSSHWHTTTSCHAFVQLVQTTAQYGFVFRSILDPWSKLVSMTPDQYDHVKSLAAGVGVAI